MQAVRCRLVRSLPVLYASLGADFGGYFRNREIAEKRLK